MVHENDLQLPNWLQLSEQARVLILARFYGILSAHLSPLKGFNRKWSRLVD